MPLTSDAIRMALWPVTEAAGAARRVERRTRAAAGDLAGRTALVVVDAVVASPYTEQAVGRMLESPLVEATARELAGHAVVERVAEQVLRAGVADRVADRILAAGSVERVAERILDGPELGQVATRLVESPAVERLVTRIAESQAIEHTVTQVMDSRLVDQVVAGLLESEELWLLVDEIAQSPAVTEAIAQQGLGFADEVADQVNQRTRRADAITERVARRLLHRHARVEPPPPAVNTP